MKLTGQYFAQLVGVAGVTTVMYAIKWNASLPKLLQKIKARTVLR